MDATISTVCRWRDRFFLRNWNGETSYFNASMLRLDGLCKEPGVSHARLSIRNLGTQVTFIRQLHLKPENLTHSVKIPSSPETTAADKT
jgi:hypothetical protein